MANNFYDGYLINIEAIKGFEEKLQTVLEFYNNIYKTETNQNSSFIGQLYAESQNLRILLEDEEKLQELLNSQENIIRKLTSLQILLEKCYSTINNLYAPMNDLSNVWALIASSNISLHGLLDDILIEQTKYLEGYLKTSTEEPEEGKLV